jgi:hypothetical protein
LSGEISPVVLEPVQAEKDIAIKTKKEKCLKTVVMGANLVHSWEFFIMLLETSPGRLSTRLCEPPLLRTGGVVFY